jgi:hypothetical protein
VSSSVPSATLDTNVPVEYWRDQERKNVVAELLDLARDGHLDLAICRRVRDDVPDEPLRSRLAELPALRIAQTGKPAVLDEWVLDVDHLGSDEFVGFLDSEGFVEAEADLLRRGLLAKRRRPSAIDWDHVHAHFALGRDVFLTWDRGILAWADELRERFGIVVATPDEYIARREHG